MTLNKITANSNNANYFGGAIYNEKTLYIMNSIFERNNAQQASAIYSTNNLIVDTCEFSRNTVSHSYGIIKIVLGKMNLSNSIFQYNSGSDESGCIFNFKGTVNIENTKFILNEAKSHGGAIDNNGNLTVNNCEFKNNHAYGAGAIDNGGNLVIKNSRFIENRVRNNGGAIDTNGLMTITDCIFKKNTAKNEGGAIIIRGDTNISNSSFIENSGGIGDAIFLNDDIAAVINDNWWGVNEPNFDKLLNKKPNDLTWIIISSKILTSTLTKEHNSDKSFVITLKDSLENTISNAQITVEINGKNYTLHTDSNGQIKLNLKLAPKTYTATITYIGDAQHVGFSNKYKVSITKTTPKIIASQKTFKVKTKIKKYTVTLKDNKGKIMKKAKLTIKINGRTFKATTNSNGKATFKLTKLNKKGKFTSSIKFSGNGYYKPINKKIRIYIK